MARLPAQQWVDWAWVSDHRELILDRLREHVELTVIAVGIVMLMQPVMLELFTWSFSVILAGTVLFIAASHFPD